jgi:hypothetical protein
MICTRVACLEGRGDRTRRLEGRVHLAALEVK